MNIKSFVIGTALIILGLGSNAYAVPVAHNCNSCTSQQIRQMALTYAPSAFASGSAIYIYDFTNDSFAKFMPTREPSGGGQFTYEVIHQQLAGWEQNYFDASRGAWVETAHAMHQGFVIDPSNPHSGDPGFPSQVSSFILSDPSGFYGIARNSAMQNYLKDYANSWMNHYVGATNGFTDLWSALNLAASFVWEGQNHLGVTFTIVVPGGDQVVITLTSNPGSNNPTWSVVSMRDRNNNDVPMTPDQAAPPDFGENMYSFNLYQQDLTQFLYYLDHVLHIPVQQGEHGGWTVGCAVDRNTGASRCIRVF